MAGILKELGVESDAVAPVVAEPEAPQEKLEFEPYERELELAAADAEKRKASAPERIRHWLELAELHRHIAVREQIQKKSRLKQAEMVVRRAVEIAAQAKDTLGYISSLDALAEIFIAMNDFPAAD